MNRTFFMLYSTSPDTKFVNEYFEYKPTATERLQQLGTSNYKIIAVSVVMGKPTKRRSSKIEESLFKAKKEKSPWKTQQEKEAKNLNELISTMMKDQDIARKSMSPDEITRTSDVRSTKHDTLIKITDEKIEVPMVKRKESLINLKDINL